jgi:hypothetical protein
MIKTLRITSIIMVALAAVFVVLPAVFGVRSDKEVEQFLNSPGAIEKFNKTKGDRARDSDNQTSPLIKQAEAFALYLNPPRKTEPDKTTEPQFVPKPPVVSSKFTLVGTSYYVSHPELSLALIDEPGKGLHWVRQSAEVGHLIIEEIKDGLVVVRDGQRTFEVVAPRPEKRSLLKGSSSGETESKPATLEAVKADTGAARSRPPRLSAEKSEAFKQLVGELEAMQFGVGTDKTGTERGADKKKNVAAMKQLISDFEATRVSTQEAQKLDSLGKELDGNQPDPNQAKYRKVERARRPRRPRTSTGE